MTIPNTVKISGYYINQEKDSFGPGMADVYYHFEGIIKVKKNDSFETMVKRAYNQDWTPGWPRYKGIENVATGSIKIEYLSLEEYKELLAEKEILG